MSPSLFSCGRDEDRNITYELYKASIKGKLYRLMFLLNQNIRIRVKTPLGHTDARDTGPGVGQGTVMGAVISSNNLDGGIKEFFHPEDINAEENAEEKRKQKDEKVRYNNVVLHPLLWQDDVFNASSSVAKAQEANNKMINLVESKLLDLNIKKSVFLIAGRKKAREKLQEELNASPLMLYDMKMKQVDAEKYLGMWVSATAAASVSTTVSKRIGLATRSIFETRTIVEHCRANVLGGLSLAFTFLRHV